MYLALSYDHRIIDGREAVQFLVTIKHTDRGSCADPVAAVTDYDVVVIGGGPGGYVGAIRCAQLGMRVAVVECWRDPAGDPALGGTCLNVGCIPSKALLDSSHHFEHLNLHAQEHGILTPDIGFSVPTMISRKNQIVKTLTGGIAGLFKKNKIEWLKGARRPRGQRPCTDRARGRRRSPGGICNAHHCRYRLGPGGDPARTG